MIGKKAAGLILACAFAYLPCMSMPSDVEHFLKKYPTSYQDVIIHNQVIALGTDICVPRYDMIKPVLDLYQRPFTMLELGAAQGYFSFNIAHNYPLSTCVMIDANTDYYSNHGDMLYDLCLLNSHLDNVCYLNRKIDLSDLTLFNKEEHFDIVMALLVVHQVYDTLPQQIKVIESLLKLGDNVIIEVASDVAMGLSGYVEFLSQKMDCVYLGEVIRHKDPTCPCTGKLFWFKTKDPQQSYRGIKNATLSRLNKVYP